MNSDVINFYRPENKIVDDKLIPTSSPQDLIDSGIEKIEVNVKNHLLQRLKDFDPYAFEKVVLVLLKKMGIM